MITTKEVRLYLNTPIVNVPELTHTSKSFAWYLHLVNLPDLPIDQGYSETIQSHTHTHKHTYTHTQHQYLEVKIFLDPRPKPGTSWNLDHRSTTWAIKEPCLIEARKYFPPSNNNQDCHTQIIPQTNSWVFWCGVLGRSVFIYKNHNWRNTPVINIH